MAVYLSFIGKRYYTKERFIKEGVKYGVQRVAPFNLVYSLFRSKSIVYYSFMNEEYNIAQVFAYGKVNGIATTDPEIHQLLRNKCGASGYTYEHRGCGSCYTTSYPLSYEEILEILEVAKNRYKEGKNMYRWFYLTDIDVYDTAIDNVMQYKVRAKQIVVSDIAFTRSLIMLNGIDVNVSDPNYIMKSVIRHRLKGSNEIDDIKKTKATVDTSKYTSLDRWMVGLC
jgi:hypothetical protein